MKKYLQNKNRFLSIDTEQVRAKEKLLPFLYVIDKSEASVKLYAISFLMSYGP